MGTLITQPKIPVIKMEELKAGTNSWVLACHKVRQTLEEYGCFMAIHHFSKVMHSYANQASNLEKMVRKMVFESYGVEKSYDESMSYLLKFSKYTAPKEIFLTVIMKAIWLLYVAHTDKTFISILGQNDVNGLQVQVNDGEWVTVDFLPSSFIVIVGDAFMAWSNGRLRSSLHRVVTPRLQDRYSILLFVYKNGIIEIPQELIDDQHPPKFKPFDHFKFFENRSRDRDCLDERAIKLYCGI